MCMEDLNWGDEKLVMTKFGERFVRVASPTSSFWNEWKTKKQELKDSGISVSKDDNGDWVVTHWKEVDQAEKSRNKELSRATDLDIEIPAPEGLTYLGYQKAGIHFAQNKDSLIADEMGLGKTIQAIGVINLNPGYQNILIICPASLRLNWKKELNKWLINPYTIGVVNRADYPEDTSIVIMNYDVAEKHKDKLRDKEWDLLIIDEAHYLKNSKAKRTRAILGHGKKDKGIPAKHRVFLTGTPILNRPIELFSLINALDESRWGSLWKYAHRYCDAKNTGWGWDFSGSSNLEELQDLLRSTIMIRRLKKDVLTELPPKRRQVIEIEPTAAVAKLVKEENKTWNSKNDVIESLRLAVELSKASEDVSEYRAAMRNLKEGISATFTEMAALRQQIALEKVPYVIEHIQNTSEKVVVFAHHKSVISAMKEALGEEAVVLVGDTKMEDRQAAVEAFQSDPKVKYFLGSIKAAGVGITLTAASHVVFAELDWVPGNISQAEDRCHRVGQLESVLVQHIVVEQSLDAKMAESLIDKQEIIDRALDIEVEVVASPEIDIDRIKLPSFERIEKEAEEEVSDEEKAELLKKLRILSSYDFDRAAQQNDVGFNRFDTRIGNALAAQDFLTNKQAVIARKLTHKYRRQLE